MLGKLDMVGIVMVDDDDSNSIHQQPLFPCYVWGSSNKGQLGSQEQLIIEPRQTTIPNIKRISMVACGGSHTLIVSEAGSLFAMGDNLSGQLGVGLKAKMTSEPIAVEFLGKL
jgi:X-linked retinitis pigmentosa GTPase regulator